MSLKVAACQDDEEAHERIAVLVNGRTVQLSREVALARLVEIIRSPSAHIRNLVMLQGLSLLRFFYTPGTIMERFECDEERKYWSKENRLERKPNKKRAKGLV